MIYTNHQQELNIVLTEDSISDEVDMLATVIKISQKVGLKKEFFVKIRGHAEERFGQIKKELGLNVEIKKTPYK